MPSRITFPLLSVLCIALFGVSLVFLCKAARSLLTGHPVVLSRGSLPAEGFRPILGCIFFGLLFGFPGMLGLVVIISEFGWWALLRGPAAQ